MIGDGGLPPTHHHVLAREPLIAPEIHHVTSLQVVLWHELTHVDHPKRGVLIDPLLILLGSWYRLVYQYAWVLLKTLLLHLAPLAPHFEVFFSDLCLGG